MMLASSSLSGSSLLLQAGGTVLSASPDQAVGKEQDARAEEEAALRRTEAILLKQPGAAPDRLAGIWTRLGWLCLHRQPAEAERLFRKAIDATSKSPPGQPAPAAAFIGLGSAVGELLQARRPEDPPAVGWLVDGEAAPGTRTSLVRLEDEAAGREAVAHLRGRGCRSLVWVGHQRRPSPAARCTGVHAACAECGLPLTLVESGMAFEDGLAAAATLPRGPGLGIIAANDWLAAGLHAGLGARRPPLVGFDGLALSQRLGIGSFRVPLAGIAADALAELRRLAGEPRPPGRTLGYRLELRA